VVLDEPNANLDAEGEQALLQALAELKAQGSTVILITHKPSLVSSMDYLMLLRDGRVELLGPREDVLARLSGQSAPPQSGVSPLHAVTT
jgi:ABC-type protease/lipase transport system fused ATPase/permease subunit